MTEDRTIPRGALAGPGIMLLSAAIFGYFGFTTSWNYHSAINGQFLLYVAMLDWTLKGTAIAFVLSALLTFAAPVAGNVLFAGAGLVSAALFVVIAVMDIADTQHTAMSPLILFLFAAWNGFGSWTGLRNAMLVRRIRAAPRGNPWQADADRP